MISLINPPSDFLIDPKSVYPLGLLTVATAFQEVGQEVEFIDLADSTDPVGEAEAARGNIIGLTAVTAQYKWLKIFADKGIFNGKYTVVGGAHACAESASILDLGYSAVCTGPGEDAIPKLLSMETGVINCSLPGNIRVNRSLVSGYRGPAPLMVARGCPYSCSFCAHPKSWRLRDVSDVVDEINNIIDSHIVFYDDTLTANRKWTIDLCERLKDTEEHVFRCSTRADKVDAELLTRMRRAHFREVAVGIESGDQGILDVLNKQTTVEQNTEARRLSRETGLRFRAFIMLGSPGESHRSIENTRTWLRKNEPDSVAIYIFKPLPGCDIWKHPEKYDISFEKNFEGYYGGRPEEIVSSISTSHLTRDEITAYYREFIKEFS